MEIPNVRECPDTSEFLGCPIFAVSRATLPHFGTYILLIPPTTLPFLECLELEDFWAKVEIDIVVQKTCLVKQPFGQNDRQELEINLKKFKIKTKFKKQPIPVELRLTDIPLAPYADNEDQAAMRIQQRLRDEGGKFKDVLQGKMRTVYEYQYRPRAGDPLQYGQIVVDKVYSHAKGPDVYPGYIAPNTYNFLQQGNSMTQKYNLGELLVLHKQILHIIERHHRSTQLCRRWCHT